MSQEEEEQTINMEEKVVTCPCGGEAFRMALTNGTDGKTFTIWLTCIKCRAQRGMRKIMKSLGYDNV